MKKYGKIWQNSLCSLFNQKLHFSFFLSDSLSLYVYLLLFSILRARSKIYLFFKSFIFILYFLLKALITLDYIPLYSISRKKHFILWIFNKKPIVSSLSNLYIIIQSPLNVLNSPYLHFRYQNSVHRSKQTKISKKSLLL